MEVAMDRLGSQPAQQSKGFTGRRLGLEIIVEMEGCEAGEG